MGISKGSKKKENILFTYEPLVPAKVASTPRQISYKLGARPEDGYRIPLLLKLPAQGGAVRPSSRP